MTQRADSPDFGPLADQNRSPPDADLAWAALQGGLASQHGLGSDVCPYSSSGLRESWMKGWNDIENAKRISEALFNMVCSPRPRPAVHSGRKGGNQWWARDVFHATAGDGRTLCGVPCADWLKLDPRPKAEVLADSNLCRRCSARI